MDSVLSDFEGKVYETFKQRYPHRRAIPPKQRTTFYASDQYPEEYYSDIEAIYNAEGFFASLEEIPGSVASVKEMKARGAEIFICTTAPKRNIYAPSEKREWIRKHLGPDWVDKFVLTHDKTLVIGDYLIDDRPEVKGAAQPTWEHIIYSQPYNFNVQGLKRMTWDNWEKVFEGFF